MNFDTIVWHYTATYEDQDIGYDEIDKMHRARGFAGPGYHFIIKLDGTLLEGRPLTRIGAHVKGQNAGKIGCTNVGGLRRATGKDVGVDTRTPAQLETQARLTHRLVDTYSSITRICGHKDLASTQCPAYDVGEWWEYVANGRTPVQRPAVPASGAPVVTHHTIRQGARGKVVLVLQRALAALGFYDYHLTDGVFGPITRASVIAFQRSRNIDADGIVGPMTWVEIFKA